MRLLLVVLGIILVVLALLKMSGQLDHERVLRDAGGKFGAPNTSAEDNNQFDIDTGGYRDDSPQAGSQADASVANEMPGAP